MTDIFTQQDEDLLNELMGDRLLGRSKPSKKYYRQNNPKRATACDDFEAYQELFSSMKKKIKNKECEMFLFNKIKANGYVTKSKLFEEKSFVVLNGLLVYINKKPKRSGRMHLIYSNGTESKMLFLSFVRAMNRDKSSRVIFI